MRALVLVRSGHEGRGEAGSRLQRHCERDFRAVGRDARRDLVCGVGRAFVWARVCGASAVVVTPAVRLQDRSADRCIAESVVGRSIAVAS
jgi:hypothetical protein